tara:strand:- start:19009 stop:21078 length:2070 start_codon:yes stop_codon:yes gene_type:complete
MSRARDLSRFANNQAISIDSSLNVGINSTSPDAKLDVAGIVSATEFFGDGSNLTGVSSPGLGTALSDDTTSPLNSIYFTNANLSVASTITVNPPSSASAAFTQYANIVLQNDADLIVADGDTFIPDILGIGTDVDEPGTLTGGAGKLRVDNITNKAGTGSPNFPFGMVIAGIFTATGGSFSGNVSVGGTLTYEDVTNIDSVGIITAQSGIHIDDSIVHLGDTNTKIRFPAADTITAETGGTERLRITSDGKVGIGLTNPDVFSASADDLVIRTTGDTGITIRSGASDSGNIFFASADSASSNNGIIKYLQNTKELRFQNYGSGSEFFTFYAQGNEKVRITSAGNVGIGLTNPTGKLHTIGDVMIQGTGGVGEQTLFIGRSATFLPNSRGVAVAADQNASAFHDMVLKTSTNSSGLVEQVRITSNGNVAIGTDTISNSNLTIFGDGTTDNKPATLYQNALTGTGSDSGFYVGTNHNDQVGYVWNYEPHALSFATNDTVRLGITSEGYLNPAPSGMVIRSGFYDPGTGTNATTSTTSSTFTTLNVDGTGQVGHNIGKFSTDGLTYTKVSSNSHLNISISIPFYLATGGTGFGIRALLSTDDGNNYYVVTGLSNGPADKWGAGGYGGNTSGILNYTWNTRMNSSRASAILSKTGTIRFYFQVAVWSSSDTLTIGDYPSYNKKSSIIVQEIAE